MLLIIGWPLYGSHWSVDVDEPRRVATDVADLFVVLGDVAPGVAHRDEAAPDGVVGLDDAEDRGARPS